MNVAKILKGQFGSTKTGTPFYAGPELWQGKPQYLSLDIWSLGCILHEMLTLRVPFNGDDIPQLKKSILNDEILDIPIDYSPELNLLVKKLLQKDPLRRPSCQQIMETPIIQKFLSQAYNEGLRDPILHELAQFQPDNGIMLSTIKHPKEFLYL